MNAPRSRNKRDENQQIKEGKTPEDCNDQPNMKWQKDLDARWTKKRGKSHYGYKNHINIDKENKLIRRYEVTDASVHDSQVFDDLMDEENSSRSVWADSAYLSKQREEQLREQGIVSRIQRKGHKTKREQESSRSCSKTRSRVEQLFGNQRMTQGSTKGIVRAAVKIGMMNLTYNMRRMEFLLTGQSVQMGG